MKPYYEQDGITIYHGDCRDVIPTLPSIDLVIADPPYGETSLPWDVVVDGWTDALVPLMSKHSSMWVFGSLRSLLATSGAFLKEWNLAQDIVWEKHNGSNFHADRFRRVHELAVQFYPMVNSWAEVHKSTQFTNDATNRTVRRKGSPTHMGAIESKTFVSIDGGPRLQRSVIHVPSCHGYAVHPTQKPVGIIRPLIKYSLPMNGVVIDPFMGSGTTLVVAKQDGRRAVGIELEERYCEIAAKRLQQSVLDLEVA